MTTPFSERFGYEPIRPLIVDDAPDRVRLAFIDLVLKEYVYVDRAEYDFDFVKPLGAKELYETLTANLLVIRDESYTDSYQCLDTLWHLIRSETTWQGFYDVVEYVGRELLKKGRVVSGKRLTYAAYRDSVNALFGKAGVVWKLNAKAALEPNIPKELAQALNDATSTLSKEHRPSLAHLNKAIDYALDREHLDPENAIKETVSALESLGKAMWPGASTLGDIVQEMKKSDLPRHLVAMVEKFNAFANDEPAVRHGKNMESRVVVADAEFCLYVGIALIRYLLSRPAGQGLNLRA